MTTQTFKSGGESKRLIVNGSHHKAQILDNINKTKFQTDIDKEVDRVRLMD